MPSLGDSAVIILLGLLLFGPKGLAQIARQLGKLMGEFRRASNEFRMQMEEELRLSEQVDRQKEIAAIEAAAPPPAPILGTSAFETPANETPANDTPANDNPAIDTPEENPQLRSIPSDQIPTEAAGTSHGSETAVETSTLETLAAQTSAPAMPFVDASAHETSLGSKVEPLPIAVSGDLKIMPPASGLPQPRTSSLPSTSIAPMFNSLPHADPALHADAAEHAEASAHDYAEQRPHRYTNGHTDPRGLTQADPAAEESLNG